LPRRGHLAYHGAEAGHKSQLEVLVAREGAKRVQREARAKRALLCVMWVCFVRKEGRLVGRKGRKGGRK
jgi:hypothetical protein